MRVELHDHRGGIVINVIKVINTLEAFRMFYERINS